MNNVTLIGNLGRDPEPQYFESGKLKCSISMACDTNGKTEWINVELWDKPGEVVTNYAKKGSKIAVQGSIKTDSWEAKDGSGKRYRTYVNAYRVELLDRKPSSEDEPF